MAILHNVNMLNVFYVLFNPVRMKNYMIKKGIGIYTLFFFFLHIKVWAKIMFTVCIKMTNIMFQLRRIV